jgi:hypothetical protein
VHHVAHVSPTDLAGADTAPDAAKVVIEERARAPKFEPNRVARIVSHVAVWCAVGLPTLVALLRGWTPTGDDANISEQSYQVFGPHPPVVGYTTTTAHAGQALHDFGPLLFWLLAVPVRLDPLHGALWGAALWGGIVLSVAIEAMWSTGRWLGCLLVAFAAVDYLVLLPTAMDNLTWNAFFPIPFLIAAIALAWVIASGSLGWWPVLVAVGSVAAQTHLIYAPIAVILVIGAPAIALGQHGRPTHYRWLAWGLTVAVVCWLAPLIQNFAAHGNLSAVLTSQHGQAHEGLSFGLKTVAFLAAPPPIWLRPEPLGFFPVFGGIGANGSIVGIVVLLVLAAIGVVAWRQAQHGLSALALLALGSSLGVLVGFAQIPKANGINVDYAISMLWAVGILVWTVAAWTAVLLLQAVWAKRSTASSERLTALAPLAAPFLLIVLAVAGLVLVTDSNRTLDIDTTAMTSVGQIAGRIQQLAPRGPVGVYVANIDTGALPVLEIDEGVAWRLVSADRHARVEAVSQTYTGFEPLRNVEVFEFVIDDERLLSFETEHCRELDLACVHHLKVALEARYPVLRPTTR